MIAWICNNASFFCKNFDFFCPFLVIVENITQRRASPFFEKNIANFSKIKQKNAKKFVSYSEVKNENR